MEVTPELGDGYEGVVRKIVCLDCQKPFYIAKDDFERIQAQYCHACSLQRISVVGRSTKKQVSKVVLKKAEHGMQHGQAEEVKNEVMSPEDKRELYAALQDIANELRRIHLERRK